MLYVVIDWETQSIELLRWLDTSRTRRNVPIPILIFIRLFVVETSIQQYKTTLPLYFGDTSFISQNSISLKVVNYIIMKLQAGRDNYRNGWQRTVGHECLPSQERWTNFIKSAAMLQLFKNRLNAVCCWFPNVLQNWRAHDAQSGPMIG